ncbi:MAG: dihydroneopterin aldolase [Saprospiraceae bacterium]|nr:dihydroneopterin aldolase [Saprospiraceae bacterium]
MHTLISVQRAEFYAYHGWYEEERLCGNLFIVDAEVTLPFLPDSSDDITHTVNYEKIYTICTREMQNTAKLLETVAVRILHNLKEEFPSITHARVRIEKQRPQLGGKVDASVVEVVL